MSHKKAKILFGVIILILVIASRVRIVHQQPRPEAPRQASIPQERGNNSAGRMDSPKEPGAVISEKEAMPDPVKTPGAVFPVTAQEVCVRGYSKSVRNVPESVKRAVYASYGIEHHRPREFEVDHLISLELGGSNSIQNLWPESYLTTPWNARVKDVLENRLHKEVCEGRMSLGVAQDLIAHDWVQTYVRYYGQPKESGK